MPSVLMAVQLFGRWHVEEEYRYMEEMEYRRWEQFTCVSCTFATRDDPFFPSSLAQSRSNAGIILFYFEMRSRRSRQTHPYVPLTSITRLQLRILERAMNMLKPGGRLVYSTCSFNPLENEAVIAAALNANPGTSYPTYSSLPTVL